MWLCVFVCFVTFVCQIKIPLVPWRNSTPFFGVAAICTTKIDEFRASLTTLSSHSSKSCAGETHTPSGKPHPHHFWFQKTYIIIKVFGQPSSATYWHEQSVPVGRRQGGPLATTLVATKNVFIFFPPFLRRLLFSQECSDGVVNFLNFDHSVKWDLNLIAIWPVSEDLYITEFVLVCLPPSPRIHK